MLQSFHTMFGRLQEIWKSIRPRHLWLGVFALVLVGTFLLVEPTYAQEGVATSVGDWLLRQVAKIMLVVASLSIGLAIFFLRFFIMIASYNNYIDVSVVQLGWVMVRDVANMFFVVALLLIAFGTILGLEEYEWKKNLAKLILSAILINFSNLIAQLCIDIAHIFTITFLNAISATAGGNLVNMFKLDEILKLTAVEDPSGLDVELLAAVLPAMLFAIMAAAAIGSYVIVMMARVVALWALIVISPLAFILGVIPQTKSYADKWWAEFSKYVIVAPIMVFFLWLAFATLGLGGIAAEIERDLPTNVQISPAEQQFGGQRLSMSQVTSWENMANFLVAFAFLMFGIKATQETGVVGSGMIGSAVDFGKKVATIASGYAAGRWLVGKTAGLAKDGAVGAGTAVFGGYVEQVKNFAKRQTVGAYQNWKTAGPQKAEDDKEVLVEAKLLDQNRQLTESEIKAGYSIEDRGKEGKFLVQGLSEMDVAKGYEILEEKNEKGEIVRSKLLQDKYALNIKTDDQGNVLYKKDAKGKFLEDENGNRIAEGSDEPVYESTLQRWAYKSHAALLTSRKKLEKVENDTKLNEEIMDKTIDAQPSHWLSTSNKSQQKDYDRFKRGMLAAMEKRSSAKSEEFASRGEKMVMDSKRFKDGKFQTERGTIAEQVAMHEGKAAASRKELDQVVSVAKERFLGTGAGKKAFEGKIKAELEVKARDASISKIEAGITTDVALAAIEGTKAENAKMDKYRQELEGAQSGPPDQFYAKQEEILKKMMGEGLVSKDEYEEISKNQRINEAMQTHSGMDKEAALGELVKEGVISENEKKKVAEKMGAGREMSYTFPKAKESAIQRKIAGEKAAHFEGIKLEVLEKKEEELFTKSGHGVAELEEEVVLKAKIGSSDNIIKQLEAEAKSRVITGEGLSIDSTEAKATYTEFLKTQATSKIVADTVTTDEKIKADEAMKGIMQEGLAAQKNIGELEQEIKSQHSTASAPLLENVKTTVKALSAISTDRSKLVKAKDSAKSEEEKAKAAADLDEFEESFKPTESDLKTKLNDYNKQIVVADSADPIVVAKIKELKGEVEAKKKSSNTWKFAASKARAEESAKALAVKQNTLLNDVEQAEVYTKRGIQAPTTAITELVEKYEKEFGQMSYEMTVNNLRDNLKEMLRRRNTGEVIDESDRASMAGLFKHAFNKGYVDDGIPAIMNDPELAVMAKDAFGWEDQEFDFKKINEIQSLFATGMNKEFAKMHSQVGSMRDVAEEEFGMGLQEFFEKWQTNSFSDTEKAAFEKHKINLNTVLGSNSDDAAKNAKEYLRVTEESQAQLQLLGNLRDQAIDGNHPENGGHSQYGEIAPGKGMYLMSGSKSARNYVYGDVNKMSVTKRAAMHTHAVANIDEEDGIATRMRQDDLRIVRAGIKDSNDRRQTNVRYGNQAAGIAATEDFTEYQAADDVGSTFGVDYNGNITTEAEKVGSAAGAFLMTGQKKDGTVSKRHKNRLKSKAFKAEMDKAASPAQKRCITVADAVKNIYAPQIATVPKDFLMGMAEKSGIDANTALATGKMNMIVSYWDNASKKEVPVHIDNINKLIGLYNSGKFGKIDGGKLNKYIPTEGKKNNKPGETPGIPPNDDDDGT